MRVRLTGGEANTSASLRAAIRRGARRLDKTARALGDFTPVFQRIDQKLDSQVRSQFRRRSGWASLSPATIDDRDEGKGWYSQFGGGVDPGFWTGKMFDCLLGFNPQGSKRFDRYRYRRDYRLTGESYRGRDVARRALWFHEGTRTQPARPLWAPGQRERIAIEEMGRYAQRNITGNL